MIVVAFLSLLFILSLESCDLNSVEKCLKAFTPKVKVWVAIVISYDSFLYFLILKMFLRRRYAASSLLLLNVYLIH